MITLTVFPFQDLVSLLEIPDWVEPEELELPPRNARMNDYSSISQGGLFGEYCSHPLPLTTNEHRELTIYIPSLQMIGIHLPSSMVACNLDGVSIYYRLPYHELLYVTQIVIDFVVVGIR